MSIKIRCFAALALALPLGCGQSAPTRTITGQLTMSAFPTDNPVVIAQSAGQRAFVTAVSPTGRFSITVPAGQSYRLTLANTLKAGGYAGISKINWPGAGRWAQVGPGGTLALGAIHPATTGTTGGLSTADHGSDDGVSGDGSSSSESSGESERDDDGIEQCHAPGGEAKLPYAVRPQPGQSFQLSDAFALEGPQPAAILSVTMDGGTWRLAELQANASFVVTDADCTHAGNRDVGRDRVFVTWKNADGTTATDHLDIRYCDGGGSSGGSSSGHDDLTDDGCEDDGAEMCDDDSASESSCDGKADGVDRDDDADEHEASTCAAGTPAPTTGGGTTGSTGGGQAGAACTVNSDCAAGLECNTSTCIVPPSPIQ